MAAFHRIVREETRPLCLVPLAERCPLVYPNECYDDDRDKHNEETFGEEHYPDEEWRDVCRRARTYRLQDAQKGEYIAINRGCQQEVAERAFENETPMLSDIWNYSIPQEEYEYYEEEYEKNKANDSESDSESESDNEFYEEAFDAMYAIDEERARQEREEEEFWEELARMEEEEARRYHEEQLEIEEQNRWVAFEEDDRPMTRGEELEAEEEMRIRDREQSRWRLERWP